MSSSLTDSELTLEAGSNVKTKIHSVGVINLQDNNGKVRMSAEEYGGDITVTYNDESYSTARIHVDDDASGPWAYYIGFDNTGAPILNPQYLLIPKNSSAGWKVNCNNSNNELSFTYDSDL